MGQGEAVAVAEEGDDTGSHRLFARPEVHLARDQAAVPEILHRELIAARPEHLAVKTDEFHVFSDARITSSKPFIGGHRTLEGGLKVQGSGCRVRGAGVRPVRSRSLCLVSP
jgi:hypothetical protein